MGLFLDCFGDLQDPRRGNARRHDLLELLTIALAASLCGAESCVDFELFARSKEPFLREFLVLRGGFPSHDTFSRLFRLLDPLAFSDCLTRFAGRLAEPAERGPVALDGKGLRCALAHAREASPVAMVNAFASASGLALGLVGLAPGTGEIAALRALLDLLDIKGRTVTADAMHCQIATAQTILDKKADYVLTLKSNRFAMYDDAVMFMDDPAVAAASAAETVDADHGRIETRRARVVLDVAWLAERYVFPGLRGLGEILATRENGAHHHKPAPVRALSAHRCRRLASDCTLPLGHREQVALGHGCRFQRRPRPLPSRQRPPQPRRAATHRLQSRQSKHSKRLHPRKTQTSWMG